MPSYIKPQVQVFQEFQVLPTAVVQNLNAFVFGPNYQLFRYAEAAEKALIGLGAYDKDNDTDYAYPSQPAGSIVDQDYVKLYMETVWAEYLQIGAAAANPLNVVNVTERNKLRAAPVIDDAENHDTTHPSIGTTGKGYFLGQVGLPEDYYFYPTGGWTGAAWEATGYESDLSSEDGKFAYVTSEDLSGTVDIDIADTPLTAGVLTPGPDGLQLDLDAGSSDDVIHAPLNIRIEDSLGTSYFTLTPSTDYIKTFIDWAVDLTKPLDINTNVATGGANSVTWDDTNKTLDILSDGAGTPYTLAALRAALVADSDVNTYFTISAVTGTDTLDVADVLQDDGTTIDSTGDVELIPSCYRIRITPNPYTFATANGYSRTAQFKNRDVQVGDRIRYAITDDSLVTHTGETAIVALEADQTLPAVATPTVDAANGATQTGTVLASGAAIVVAGSDNQRDFDGANTKVFALDSANQKYTGELSAGIIDDTFIVEISVGGAKGTAQATVSNVSGTYYRENVLIENQGSDDGQIYIGRNVYINLDQGSGDADAIFQVGDSYTFSSDIEAPFTAVGTSLVAAGGTYEGPSDTTYVVEVIRGGVFDRVVNAIDGLSVTSGATLTPSIASWVGGDFDDEYVLKCTQAGDIGTAQFQLTSQLGDDESGVQFGAVATDITLGGKGLEAQITESGGPLTYAVGDYWVIKVNAARPQVRVTDTAGIDNSNLEVVNDATAFDLGGYGATMTFAANTNTEAGFATNGGLLKGDVFYAVATAATDGAIQTLVLADDLPDDVTTGQNADDTTNGTPNNAGIWMYLVQAEAEIESKKTQLPPDYNWETDADSITVNDDIAVQDATWYENDGSLPWLPVYKADMYVEYRAVLPALSDTIHFISDINDVETELGTITPDNPLAQGVYNALSNSGNRGVYYMAVATDDATGYDGVLDRATLSDEVYAFAPLTRNRSILNTIEAHLNDMSSETNKRWRIGFFGTEMATDVAVYNLADNPYGEEYYATIEDDPAIVGDQFTLVKFWRADGVTPAPTQVLTDVVVGDNVRINYATDAWGDAVYDEYEVGELVSNTSVKLVSGPAAAISVATKTEVWHDYTVAQMAEAVAAVSEGFANRRVYHVFPDTLGAFGVLQTSEFAAAAVAGLCSSVPPQQGLTNIELNGFDDLPMVYSTFNYSQLNTMAASGTLIIMQDVAGGRIYIRHQVSTATADGNLNTTELSVTKNLDSISYYFAEKLQPFIGQYNVTPELLDVLDTQVADGLMYLGSFTSIGLLGPQLILEGTEIQSVEQHPTLQDHVVIIVNVQLPYPLNVLELHLVV